MTQVSKLIAIMTFIFFSSRISLSQDLHYGVKVDVNYSTIQGNGIKNELNLGYGGGVWINYAVAPKIKLQPELSLTQYNYLKSEDFDKYYKNDVGRVGADKDIRLANLNVPLLLRYDIMPWISLLAGPQFGVTVFEDENLRKDGVKGFKNTNIGILGGVQATVGRAGIFGRFTRGLTNINNVSSKYKWNSRSLEFGLSLGIK